MKVVGLKIRLVGRKKLVRLWTYRKHSFLRGVGHIPSALYEGKFTFLWWVWWNIKVAYQRVGGSGGSRGGAGGSGFPGPLIFRPNWGSKPPPPSQDLVDRQTHNRVILFLFLLLFSLQTIWSHFPWRENYVLSLAQLNYLLGNPGLVFMTHFN